MIVSRKGLGDSLIAPAATEHMINMCSSAAYWFNPFCWSRSKDAWVQLGTVPTIPTSVIAGPGVPIDALTNPTGAYLGSGVSTSLSDQGITQQQQNTTDWASGLPDNPIPDAPCSWMNINCTTLAVIGVVVVSAVVLLGDSGPNRYGR